MDDIFTEKFYSLANRLRQNLNHSSDDHDLTRQEFVLMQLNRKKSENDKVSTSELSQTLMVSKSAISQMLNNLEERGFLQRTTDKSDRRKAFVNLTAAGTAVLDDSIKALHEKFSLVFSKLGHDKTNLFLSLFEELLDICEETIPNDI